ncbi:MAG: cytochrome c biogenesis protein ResB [bacterium]
MKKIFFLSGILCGVIVGVLIFGSFKNDVEFYHSPFFLLLLVCAAGIILTCLILRKKVSLTSWLIHSGFLVILTGALITLLFGYRQVIEIREGEKQGLPETNLIIRLDDFDLKFYDDGQTPREFKSTISIFLNNQLVKKGESLVNHPLSFNGFNFYQQGYELSDVRLKIVSPRGKIVFKGIGDEVIEEESGLTFKLIDFLPDFAIDSDGRTFSRSAEFKNPAVKIAAYKGDTLKENGWLFLKHKDFHHRQGKILSHLDFEEMVVEKYWSSLEVVKDPGAKIAILGSFLILLGLIRRFYFAR